MAIPRFVRPFTKNVINPITRRIAGWMPWFGLVTTVGRRSGRVYRTPLNVFRDGQEYVFALTYGSDVDWVRNVQAAGGCEMRTRGRTVHLTEPRLVTDPSRRRVPLPVRIGLSLMRVDEFLVVTSTTPG